MRALPSRLAVRAFHLETILELQAALISMATTIITALTGVMLYSARTRFQQKQKETLRVKVEADQRAREAELEAKRQEAEEKNRLFLVAQVDRAIANADEARKVADAAKAETATIADAAKKDAANWRLLTDSLQEQLNSATAQIAFFRKQTEELSAILQEQKKSLESMPELKRQLEDQQKLVDILTAQLANIPKLEAEIQRLHLAQEAQSLRIGELQHERGEISRLLEAERKIHRLNEDSLKKEIAGLKAQVQTLTDENTTLRQRIARLEIPNISTNNNKTEEAPQP